MPGDVQDLLNCAIGEVGNPWLNPESDCHRVESDMNDHLKTESINLVGATFRYYVVEGTDTALFRGMHIKTVERVFKIRMSMDDMPGQQRVAGLMGLFDDISLSGQVSIQHWKKASTYGPGFAGPGTFAPLPCPRIGDVLLSEANGLLYDIVFSSKEESMFQYKSHVHKIQFKPFEDKKYIIGPGDSIPADDPIRKTFRTSSLEDGGESLGEYLFATPPGAIAENARVYEPDSSELPPNNDKDNPFPRF